MASSASPRSWSRPRRPSAASSASSSSSAPLPFPEALPRKDFVGDSFDPVAYLSALLPDRHQTLEDLRADLRDRSAAISVELLELVNDNYTAFLSLGGELRGGDDRVEDVRVALLAFRRQVEEVRGGVRAARDEVGGLAGELAGVRREIETARKMLDLDEGVAALEARLLVGSDGPRGEAYEEDYDDDDADADDTDDDSTTPATTTTFVAGPAKLAALARDYRTLELLADAIGRDAAFVARTEERLARCRNTILLDLGAALQAAHAAGSPRTVRLLAVYRTLDAAADAVKTLKAAKSKAAAVVAARKPAVPKR
jgi:hypothetical protein